MKIALIGYGKMDRMIEEIALDRGHEIVSIIDIDNQQDFESEAFASADVAIEFTNPTVAYSNYLKAWAKGVKVVSGSTGWLKEHGDEVRKACGEGGNAVHPLGERRHVQRIDGKRDALQRGGRRGRQGCRHEGVDAA